MFGRMRTQPTFQPFDSRDRVRFYIQRPTGYMSVYTLAGARNDVRNGLRFRGSRDPMFVSILGRNPIRLPSLCGPVTPRKTRCTAHTKAGPRCTQLTWNLDSVCRSHQPSARVDRPHQCTGARKDGERCTQWLATAGRCRLHETQPADHPSVQNATADASTSS